LQGLPSVDIVNSLNIEGELFSAFRGKELILAIGKVMSIQYMKLKILSSEDFFLSF
jgi:hypothetical protein